GSCPRRALLELLEVSPNALTGRVQPDGLFKRCPHLLGRETEFCPRDGQPLVQAAPNNVRRRHLEGTLAHAPALLEAVADQVVVGKEEVRPDNRRVVAKGLLEITCCGRIGTVPENAAGDQKTLIRWVGGNAQVVVAEGGLPIAERVITEPGHRSS